MRPYVVRLSLKLASLIYLCLCVSLYIYSKRVDVLLISVVISILFICTIYTLANVVEGILSKQFSIIHFISHYLIVVLLIFLVSFISIYNVTKIIYIVVLLISYPITLLLSFAFAYTYSKKFSRK